MQTDTLYPIPKIRWFFLFAILCSFGIPTLFYVALELHPNLLAHYWDWLGGTLGFQAGLIVASVMFIWRQNLSLRSMVGRFYRQDAGVAVEFTALNIALTFVVLYAIYYPLSLIEATKSWVITLLIELPQLVIFDGMGYPVFANIVVFCSIVIIAPVTEEIVFRGFLFARLKQKHSFWIAAIASSLVFGLLHGEAISAGIFGVMLCYCYQKSGRLMVPIAVHVLNNLLVWLLTAWEIWTKGSDITYTLPQFQAEWYYGVVAAIAMMAWLIVFALRKTTLSTFKREKAFIEPSTSTHSTTHRSIASSTSSLSDQTEGIQ